MSFRNYDFKEELDSAIGLHGSVKSAGKAFRALVSGMPPENRVLYNGKLYVFKYKEDTKKLYDANPHVISLGFTGSDKSVYYCIDLKYVPYKIRVQMISLIYDAYMGAIDAAIGKYPATEDALLQDWLPGLTQGGVKNLARKTNIIGAVHRYRADCISDCRCVNYNLAHLMACSEENTFENGDIAGAQELFMKAFSK